MQCLDKLAHSKKPLICPYHYHGSHWWPLLALLVSALASTVAARCDPSLAAVYNISLVTRWTEDTYPKQVTNSSSVSWRG